MAYPHNLYKNENIDIYYFLMFKVKLIVKYIAIELYLFQYLECMTFFFWKKKTKPHSTFTGQGNDIVYKI